MKACTKCKKEKPKTLEFFYKDNKRKSGFKVECKECMINANKKNKIKRREMCIPHWTTIERRKNKANKLGISYKNWCYVLEQRKIIAFRRNKINKLSVRLNKCKLKKDSNHYRFFYKVTNKDWANYTKDSPKEKTLIYRIKYKYDTKFNLKEKRRSATNKQKKKYPNLDYSIRNAVSNNTNTRYCELFDYTIEQLQEHLEKQFTLGMNWVAFRAGKIHIDHIKPQSLFDLSNDIEYKKCWSLNNLQPLWAADNLAKSNFYVEDL